MIKILAIDDVNDNLISLKAIIQNAFSESIVFTALNGAKGIDLAIAQNPDVILLDIVMPDLDGFEVCRQLKHDERVCDIPVVFLTAVKGDKENRIKALEAGAEAFLSKPIDETELTVQIKAMVKIKRANEQKRNEKERLNRLVTERTYELEQNQIAMLQLLNGMKAENEARIKTEEALRESEIHFRTLADSGQVLIWTSGIDKKCNYFNQIWLNFTGRTLEQELGDGWTEGVHPDDLQHCVSIYTNAFHLRKKFSMEYRIRHFTGEYMWIQDDGTPRYNSKNEFIGYIGHCLNIHERKQMDEILKASELKHRTLFETMLQGAIYQDADGKIISANKSAQRILGLSLDQMIGRTSIDPRWKAIHEDGSDFPGETHPAIVALKTGKEIPNVIMGVFNPQNESYGWVNICSVPQFKPGESKPYQVFTTLDDINERKRSEEALKESEIKFRTLFTQMSEGFALHEVIYDTDSKAIDYKIIDINPAFEKQVGIKTEKAFGRLASELYEVSPVPYLDIYANVAETGDSQFFQTYFPPLDRYFEISVFSPKSGYFATVFSDITEQKKAEEILIENENRLRELNAAKDKFFSIISHDLRSPFNAIIGFSEILEEQVQNNDNKEISKYAKIIKNSSLRAMDLLVNLLEWSRSQTGRMEFNPKNIEIATLINEAAILLNDTAKQKMITIYTEYTHNDKVFADRAMIDTILRNLISNAIKFTNPGGEIVISAEQKKNEVLIAVSDNGIGIGKSVIDKLFRIDTSTKALGTHNELGTGLGLILCKEFVDKHGGEIWVDSELSKGSMFCFTIPNN